MTVKKFYLKEKLRQGLIALIHCASADLCADMLTKILVADKAFGHMHSVGLENVGV
jgi:hypothetical protein